MSTHPNQTPLRYARFGPFELDRVEAFELAPEPSASQLRVALLLTYAGLLLTLSTLF